MPAPIHSLRKDEILKLAGSKCSAHSHNYLEHYSCYLKEHPEKEEKIGYLDIETSNLDADYGQVLSWAIKDGGSDDVYYDVFSMKDIKSGSEDKRIIQSCIDTMSKFSKIVTYFGSRFDIPYLRARALINGLDFPVYGTMVHKDLYFLIRAKFKLSSRRLENACKQLLGSSDKTRIESIFWRQALRGDKKAINYVLDHNIKDVTDLQKLYEKVIDYGKVNNNSI